MDRENEPIVLCVKLMPTEQVQKSEDSECSLHNDIKSRCTAIRFVVRKAIVDSIKETLGDCHSIVEIGRLAISFDPSIGEYLVSCLITPQAFSMRLANVVVNEAGYRLSKNPRFRKTICRHVNRYIRGKKVLKGYTAKVGIHSFDDLVESCDEDSAT